MACIGYTLSSHGATTSYHLCGKCSPIGYDLYSEVGSEEQRAKTVHDRAGVRPLVKGDYSVGEKASAPVRLRYPPDSRSRVLLECPTVSRAASLYAEASIRDGNAWAYLSGSEQKQPYDHAMLAVYPAREVVVMVASDVERRSYPKIPARNWFDLRRRINTGAAGRDNCGLPSVCPWPRGSIGTKSPASSAGYRTHRRERSAH